MGVLSSALLLFPPWFFLVPHQVSFIAVLSFLWGEKKQHTHLSLQLGLWQFPTEKPLMIHDCLHTKVLTLSVSFGVLPDMAAISPPIPPHPLSSIHTPPRSMPSFLLCCSCSLCLVSPSFPYPTIGGLHTLQSFEVFPAPFHSKFPLLTDSSRIWCVCLS